MKLMLDTLSQPHRPGPVNRIVILGGGSAGWMAAAALSQAFQGKRSIHVVESEAIGTVGVGEATIPQMRSFNHALGLDEDEFLRRTQGTFKLGIEFVDWGALGERYMHTFGSVGRDLGLVPFHHFWVRQRHLGRALPLDAYALNSLMSEAHRFSREAKPLQGAGEAVPISYAYHFDAGLYAATLRQISESRGVQRTEGKVLRALQRPADGFITALVMESGEQIDGDLFIDCSGFRGMLIEETLCTGYEDWSHWLPCNRAVAVPCESVSPLTPYTRATARTAGWQWRIPLQHRIGNGHVFSSAHIGEDEATAQLMSSLDGRALAEPRLLRFTTGRRKKMWHKNVVAMGLASGFLEPLESTSLYLVQSSISRLIRFFPDTEFFQPDIDEHNAQADEEFERIRDFIILHYHLTRRDDSHFWRQMQAMDVPETLRRRMQAFAHAGHLHAAHRDLFSDPSWLQVLVGQGLLPRRHHPLADQLNDAECAFFLQHVHQNLAGIAKRLPQHGDFVNQHCSAVRRAHEAELVETRHGYAANVSGTQRALSVLSGV
jgi:tryptophan 7-halogenase